MQGMIIVVLSGAFAVILILFQRLEKRYRGHTELSDADILFLLSRKLETSEFLLFCVAAEDWKVSEQKVENDFKAYLLNDRIPYYVRDFVRRMRPKMEKNGTLTTGVYDTMHGPDTYYVS